MDSKFKYKGSIFDKLGNMSLNKRLYLFVISEENIEYIRVDNIDGKLTYVAPSKKFSLAENAGKSLVQLYERILMNHIVEKLKSSRSQFTTKEQMQKELSRIQNSIDSSDIAKKIKEPLSEITEEAHVSRINKMLSEFDKMVYPKQEEEIFELPEKDELGETRVFKPIENIDSYITNSNNTEELNPPQNNITNQPAKEENGLSESVQITTSQFNDSSYMNDMFSGAYQNPTLPESDVEGGITESPQEPQVEKVRTLGSHPSSKKAAFADIVIFCLVIQLVLFVGLIFAMLLIK